MPRRSTRPETAISRGLLFVELAMSGVTAVGEFHYLHHAPDGTPYADRLDMSEAVIRAALKAGIRITLLRTAYFQADIAGHTALSPAQRRFCDGDVDTVLQDVEDLARRYADHERVRIGLAAHSLRAVPRRALLDLATQTRQRDLPFHMHVSQHGGRSMPRATASRPSSFSRRWHSRHRCGGGAPTSPEKSGCSAPRDHVCCCRRRRDLGAASPSRVIPCWRPLCRVDSHASAVMRFEEIRGSNSMRTTARHRVAEALHC